MTTSAIDERHWPAYRQGTLLSAPPEGASIDIRSKPPMSYQIHVGPNIRKSPYFEATVAAGVQSFSVYNHMFIPGHFGDPEAEYERLLNGVAIWDVAAERQVELRGPDAGALANYLSTRDLTGTKIGQGRYAPMCNRDGILINDPVLLKLTEERYWFSIADSDIALWADAVAGERGLDVRVFEPDASPLAIQGPKAEDVTAALLGDWVRDLKYFWFRETELDGIPMVVARSGWSKQGGYELYLTDSAQGTALWNRVMRAGEPFGIGPGAPNDVERLESDLVSYGADARYQSCPANPFELGLEKLVQLDRGGDFIGRLALTRIMATGIKRRRVGFFIEGSPISGNQHPLEVRRKGDTVGILSEMAYSHRLSRNIAVGLVSADIPVDATGLSIVIDGEDRGVGVTDLPFIR